jgi:hypothetical protein
MANSNLNRLGAQEFENLAQSLLKEVIGDGTLTFGVGQDGAREATFSGRAPYPSPSSNWDGNWIFQAKFHDVDLLGITKARRAVIRDLATELDKIVLKYKYPCDNFILITNVPLTGTADTGNIDVILNKVIPEHKGYIRNVNVWAADDINRLLEKYDAIRTKYLEFLVAGDLIAKLIAKQNAELDEVSTTISGYIAVTFSRDQNAQLDQAGDVTENALKLQKLFFDLSAQLEPGQWGYHHDGVHARDYWTDSNDVIQNIVQFILSQSVDRIVLVGGPGEGKSTIGQYLAQLHRATLLSRISEVAVSSKYHPVTPRIPIRILLRDFGQWLAEQRDQEVIHGTLEDYVCRDIKRSTSRDITPAQLHQVIKDNPILLILDGLDEVTDLSLRKTLLTRINEFTGRCEDLIKADLQILASTRPTGYVEQFDSRSYLHLQLIKLDPAQVRRYVARWTQARNLEPTKEDRVIRTIEECLADRQISLLTSTPLQVTILLLIISTGGKPQYQREALFSDYLEVIYKRETAKGRNIIETDKQLLIGLHKYIGYIIHENTTRAESTGALLPADSYSAHVEQFLRWNDPIAQSDKLRRDLNAITKEAGERLVLIIEPTEGHYGFELRSIQEYFAARHLADTAFDTEQRYARFDAVARLPYWRNVALFFAGRVGSEYLGEASNIIEVCLAMNREGPGSFIRAGSNLAIELAADRAFGPNRRLQHGLLEVAIAVFDDCLSVERLSIILGHIQRLTTDDQKEIILPLLRQRLDRLSVERLGPIVEVIQSIDRSDPVVDAALEKMASVPNVRGEAMRIFLASARPDACDSSLLRTLAAKLDVRDLNKLLGGARGEQLFAVLQCLCAAELPANLLSSMIARICQSGGFAFAGREAAEFLRSQIAQPWPVKPIDQIIRCLLIHGYLSRHDDWVKTSKSDPNWDIADVIIPESVRNGRVGEVVDAEPFANSPAMQLPVWIVHLLLGDITTQSAVEFLRFFRSNRDQPYMERMFDPLPPEVFPCFDLLMTLARFKVRPPWKRMAGLLEQFAGRDGRSAWNSIRAQLFLKQPESLRRGRHQLSKYGFFGIADVKRRSLAVSAFDGGFGELLAEYVFFRRTAPYPDDDDIDSIERLITTIARDRILTAPRATAVRRACTRRSPQHRSRAMQLVRLLEVLIDTRCVIWMPELVALSLVTCLQADEPPPELVRATLEAIKLPRGRPLLFIPVVPADSPLLYRRLVEISAEASPSSARQCARVIVMSLADIRFHMQRIDPYPSGIRFAGFVNLHRSLAKAEDSEARLTALALFAVRRPSSAEDWRMLTDLVMNCRSYTALRLLRSIGLSNWDDAKIIDQSIAFLMDVMPKVSVPEVTFLLAEWLEVLISKSGQSLAPVETALGLPLQA